MVDYFSEFKPVEQNPAVGIIVSDSNSETTEIQMILNEIREAKKADNSSSVDYWKARLREYNLMQSI